MTHEKMAAAWYEAIGLADEVLRVGEMPSPKPAAGEVRVRVHASGVNPSDTKRRSGWGGRPMDFPRIIPHSDGAGIIDEVGAEVPAERIGERVWVYSAQFGRPFGTAAEYVVVPAKQAVRLPEGTDFDEGACLGIPAMTAHYCIFADGPVNDKVLLVTGGAGTVANSAIQLAKWGGARVISTVSSQTKAEAANIAGADHVIDYRSEDVVAWVMELTGGEGVHRVVDVAFGANLGLNSEVLQTNGVLASYASDAVPEPALPFYPLLLKSVSIRLCLVYVLPEQRIRDSVADITACLASGSLHPAIGRRFTLEQVADAHQAIENGELIGNAIIRLGG